MKKRVFAAVLAVAMVFGICTMVSADNSAVTGVAVESSTKAPGTKALKIMCIGDSITQGSSVHGSTAVDGRPENFPVQTGEYSYRYPLWKMLIDKGIDFEFVGSRDYGFEGTPVYEDYKGNKFSNLHEGYWGWTIQGVTPEIKKSLESGNLPDIAIINLGTNGNEEVSVKKEYMATLIDTMRGVKSDIKIVLAGPFNTWFGDLRTAFTELAKEKSTETSPVIVTKQPAIIDHPFTDGSWTNDWVHTSKVGDEKTAEVILESLMTFITASATPTPEPTAVATIAPTAAVTTAPTATATVTPAPATPSPVVTVRFTKKKVTIKKGKKKVLKVKVKGAKNAKFSVDKKGKKVVKLLKKKAKSVTVKGKKKGKATITAKVGKKKAMCSVKVK